MSRARNIKPSFFTNDKLAECSLLSRMLFIGLWTLADREGKLEDRPKKIKAEIFPYDNCDCEKSLLELHKNGFILRYSVNDNNYIKIVNFLRHQTPYHKEQKSVIPEPTESAIETQRPHPVTVMTVPSQGHDRSDTGYLIPDSPFPEAADEKKDYWFSGKVIKLNKSDFHAWQKIYPGTPEQFWKYLDGRDRWYNEECQPETRANWFRATSANIEKLRQKPP